MNNKITRIKLYRFSAFNCFFYESLVPNIHDKITVCEEAVSVGLGIKNLPNKISVSISNKRPHSKGWMTVRLSSRTCGSYTYYKFGNQEFEMLTETCLWIRNNGINPKLFYVKFEI